MPTIDFNGALRIGRALLAGLLTFAFSVPGTGSGAESCHYVLGFASLHDQMPAIIGSCADNESHNPVNGDAVQHTHAYTGQEGLLVWRKCDNWTAFTDGYWTWVSGPFGIQKRANTQRFLWEGVTCS